MLSDAVSMMTFVELKSADTISIRKFPISVDTSCLEYPDDGGVLFTGMFFGIVISVAFLASASFSLIICIFI